MFIVHTNIQYKNSFLCVSTIECLKRDIIDSEDNPCGKYCPTIKTIFTFIAKKSVVMPHLNRVFNIDHCI